jgi:hypothetical protein
LTQLPSALYTSHHAANVTRSMIDGGPLTRFSSSCLTVTALRRADLTVRAQRKAMADAGAGG